MVLGRHGGMIQQIFMPFYLGVGGPIGSGKQYFPWIHIDDIVNLFIFAIENEEVSDLSNSVAVCVGSVFGLYGYVRPQPYCKLQLINF